MRLVRVLRRALARLDETFSKFDGESYPEGDIPAPKRYEEIGEFLRSLDLPNADASGYVEMHLERIARTLTLVPRPD